MQGIELRATGVTTIDGAQRVTLRAAGHLNGPPAILQGGLASGVLLAAARVVDPFGAPATGLDVRLHRPTPLEVDVDVEVRRVAGATYEVASLGADGEPLVSGIVELAGHEVAPHVADLLELAVVPLPAPTVQEAAPTCWVCGPHNPHGLHLLPAWHGTSIVQAFVAPFELGDDDGLLDPLVVAAILDCPTVWASQHHLDANDWRCAMLGGFHLRHYRDVPVAEPLRIVARMDDADGRKIRARAAIVDEEGVVYAVASAFQVGVADMPGVPRA